MLPVRADAKAPTRPRELVKVQQVTLLTATGQPALRETAALAWLLRT